MSMFIMGPTITVSFPRHEQISCVVYYPQKYHTSVIQSQPFKSRGWGGGKKKKGVRGGEGIHGQYM